MCRSQPGTLIVSLTLLGLSTWPVTARADAEPRSRMAQTLQVDEQRRIARIEVNGSRREKFENLDYHTVTLRASGAATVELTGRVNTLEMSVSGASTIDARELRTDVVDIVVSGNADIYVTADREFRIDASGAATIHLLGAGHVTRQEITGNVRLHRTTPR